MRPMQPVDELPLLILLPRTKGQQSKSQSQPKLYY